VRDLLDATRDTESESPHHASDGARSELPRSRRQERSAPHNQGGGTGHSDPEEFHRLAKGG